MTDVAAISARGLSHSFGSRAALREVSFDVTPSTFTVLAGANGAGKTTLAAVLTGLYWPQAGSVAFFGHDIRRERSRALSLCGVVFQQPALDLDLSVAENLAYHGRLHGLAPSLLVRRMDEELERFGLTQARGSKARELSGGNQRRVELARALLHRPRILICDEATVGLDPQSRRDLISHARALVREEGVTILWATHLLDEVADADPVLVLRNGGLTAFARSSCVGAPGKPATLEGAISSLSEAPT